MILNACYIAGFGRLHDLNYDFKEGLNTILQENGWGKTTFSVFIKAMFYGMEYSPRKKDLTEREHYLPWSGGTYGGSLTFTSDRGTYRIERTFGKKNTEDTFQLINCGTGKPSQDYSEKIGEELFGVDRDSFEKSIYVPQAAPETSMTDSLNAKMGDLASVRNDMNSFETAMQRLEEVRRDYTRTSKVNPGKLTDIRNRIREKEQIVEELPALTEAYEKGKEQLKQRESKLMSLQWDKAKLSQDITTRSKQEQTLGIYKTKQDQLNNDRQELSQLDDYFSRGIPGEEEQNRAESLESDIRLKKAARSEYQKQMPGQEEESRLQQLFSQGIPSEEDFQNYQERADQLKELRMKTQTAGLNAEEKETLSELQRYFKSGVPSSEELQAIQTKEQEKQRLLGQRKALEDNFRQTEEKQKQENRGATQGRGLRNFLMALAIVFFLGGLSFFFLLNSGSGRVIGAAITAVGIVILIFRGFLVKQMRKRERTRAENVRSRKEEQEQQLQVLDQSLAESAELEKRFMDQYPGKEEKILDRVREVQRKADQYISLKQRSEEGVRTAEGTLDQLTELQLSLYTELQPYAQIYEMDLYHDTNEQDLLQKLRRDAETEQKARMQAEKIQDLTTVIQEDDRELQTYLSRFPDAEGATESKDKLARIRTNAERYDTLTTQVEKLEKETAELSSSMELPQDGPSVEEMQKRQAQMDLDIAELNRFIQKDMEDVNATSEALVNHEDVRDQLAEDKEEEKRLKARVDILNQTRDYLEKARERFLSCYMKPLQSGMQKYLHELYERESDQIPEIREEDFELDMDLGIRFVHQGQTRTDAYLSAGYRDLTSLAARMALIDVLYKKEQPVLILDDPFTNLDGDKVQAGLHLLEREAEKRQIIYFTCHESRMIKHS